MPIDKTKHKVNCAIVADETKACDCGGITPPTETRICYDCDAVIAKNEKECPKCKSKVEEADAEDSVVERAISRLKKKRKAAPPVPKPDEPAKKKHPFASLRNLIK